MALSFEELLVSSRYIIRRGSFLGLSGTLEEGSPACSTQVVSFTFAAHHVRPAEEHVQPLMTGHGGLAHDLELLLHGPVEQVGKRLGAPSLRHM
eukprot:5943735-Pyramimonas_sp.AAC.1